MQCVSRCTRGLVSSIEVFDVCLPRLRNEQFHLNFTSWVTVRSEEEWEGMKASCVSRSLFNTRILALREALPKKKVLTLLALLVNKYTY